MGKREWTSVVLAVALAACAGDAAEEQPPMDTSAQPAPAPAAPTGGGGALPEGVTQAMVDQGKTVFETTICFSCHGMDGSGVANIGPNLRDGEWINTDGTYEGIMSVVRAGVPQPKQFPAAMPPMGGAQLTDEQIRAVSAYVYSISHGG